MRVSLRSKYSLLLICLIGVAITILLVTSQNSFKRSMGELRAVINGEISERLLEQVELRSNDMVSLLQARLTIPLYYVDLDTIHSILNDALDQKNVLSTVVFDKECKIVHDGDENLTTFQNDFHQPGQCSFLSESKIIKSIENDTITVSKAIYLGDAPIGGIAVTFSLEDIQQSIKDTETLFKQRETEGFERLTHNLIFITIFIVLFALAVSIFISSRLVNPIKMLRDHARKIGRGDYQSKIESKRNDELGDLINSFDNMRDNLKTTTVSVELLQHEIAEKNRAEEQRLLMEQELQRIQKMEAMGQLAAGVAHDLNNILSGVVTLPQLLLMDMEENNPSRRALLQIQDSGTKAANIVQDMLTLARSGTEIADPLNLKTTIEHYFDSSEHKALTRSYPQVTFSRDLTEENMLIKGSRLQLLKILQYLITNAAESITGEGKITITLSPAHVDKPFGTYDLVQAGDYLKLDIQDTGAGISEKDMPHIFEPFYTRKTMGRKGTGLGMAIVWNNIQDHNAYIDITTVKTKGTTISLFFPVSREFMDQELPETEAEIQKIDGNGEHILIVDDIQNQRHIASSILKKLNYSTATVDSGEKVLEYLDKHTTDLIILDMMMAPGMDGLETCNRVFAKHPDTLILIASGYSESEKVRAAIQLGAKRYIKKPYSVEVIGRAIKKILQESKNKK